MSNKSLLSIKTGEKAIVKEITNEKSMKDRLLDLGLTPGSRTRLLFTAPSGDPRAFLVRGAVIALRKNDCKKIKITDGWEDDEKK